MSQPLVPWNMTVFGDGVFKDVKVKSLSHIRLFAIPWTVTHQALLSVEFSRLEILEWVAVPFSWGSSRLRDSGIKPRSPALQADSLQSEPPREAHKCKRIDGISKSALHEL